MRRLIAMLALWLALATAPAAQEASGEAPAERFANPYAWIEGRWDVRYTDARRGEIAGSAVFTTSRYRPEISTRGEILFPDEQTGGVYRLQLVSVEPLAPAGADGLVRKLRLTFSGNSPPSGDTPSGERLVVELAPGQRIAATVGETTRGITTGPLPPPRQIEIELTAPEGRFDRVGGRWQRQVASEAEMMLDRAGSFTPQGEGGIVTGSETWSRFDSLPVAAQRLRGPTPDQLMAAAWRKARDQARWERRRFEPPESQGKMWLSVIGIELPVEAMRIRNTAIGPAADEIGPSPGDSDTAEAPQDQETRADNFRNVRLLGVRRNPEDGRLLDLQLELLPDFNDGPIGITVNGKTVTWYPDIAPEKPRFVRFVRRNRGDFMPIDQIYPGEVVYIEASYARPPPESSLLYALGGFAGNETPAVRLSPAEEAPIGPGGLLAYRSERILVLDAQAPQADRDRFEAARETGLESVPPFVLAAEIGAALSATPASQGRPVARARMAPPPPSLWQEALARARACRAAGGATSISNVILTGPMIAAAEDVYWAMRQGRYSKAAMTLLGMSDPLKMSALTAREAGRVVQTIPVSLEDHAAAILLRDELMRRVDLWMQRAERAGRIPDEPQARAARLRALQAEAVALMRLADMNAAHPLLNQTVPAASWNPDTGKMEWTGGEAPLRELLSRAWVEMLDRTATPRAEARRRAFLENALVQISRARGVLRGYAPKTRQRLADTDICDLRALYSNVGIGTQQVAMSLIPKLLRPPTGDEPPYPAWRPDRVAIAAVQGVSVTMAAIAAQQEWADADTDFVLTAASIPAMGLGGTAMAALDAVEALRAASEALEAASTLSDDVAYGIGLSTVAGEEYLRAARARGWSQAASAALNLGTLGLGKLAEGAGEAVARASLPEEAGEAILTKALRDGPGTLSAAERRALANDLEDLIPTPPSVGADDLADDLAENLTDTVILDPAPRSATELTDITRPAPEGTPTLRGTPEELAEEVRRADAARREFQEAPTERFSPQEEAAMAETVRQDAPTERFSPGEATGETTGSPSGGRETERFEQPKFPPLTDSRGAAASVPGGIDEDLTETVILANPPRTADDFIDTARPGMRAEAPAPGGARAQAPPDPDPIGPVAPGNPYRAQISAPGGPPVELTLEKRLGAGGYNEVFTLAGRDDAVARISLRPAEGPDLDEFGRRFLEETLPAGQPRTAAPIDIVRRIDDIPGLPRGRIERIESADPRLNGKTIEILERLPEGAASAQIARQGGMTPGQAAAFDEGMRWLNRRGLVWLDNHPGNFAFRNLGGGDWQMVVLDPGGIVPARASDLGDAAATAAKVQRMLDAPPPEFRSAFDFGNMDMRWKIKREIIQQEVLPGRVDLQAVGIPSADDMPFYAASIEAFPELSRLRALDDAAAEEARAALKAREELIERVNPKTGEPLQ